MANPLFNLLNKGGGNNPVSQFQQFMNEMRGKDPNAIINGLMQSGKITQAQLNQVQAQAQQMRGQFDGFKKMFGF